MTANPNINRFQKEKKKIRRFAFSSFITLNTRAHSTGDWAIILQRILFQ